MKGDQTKSEGLDNSVSCPLCGRDVPPELTNVHHLRPRSHGGDEEDAVRLCHMCHSFIHATFTNRTLASGFDTLRKLRADSDVRRYVQWARKQKPRRRPKTHGRNCKK
ncbi:MAG: HNH endonuclease [Planctomycetota bacterium]